MSRKLHLLSAALVVLSGLNACAPNTYGARSGQPLFEQTTLVVENNNWSDMTVYVVRQGMRARVGSVPSFGRARFTLSTTIVSGIGELRLLADPIGSNQAFLSEPIMVNPGQQVRFRVENNVQLSTYSVY